MADRMGKLKVHRSSSNKNNARENLNEERAVPLKQVVADCERQWYFQTLKAAKAGDTAMQTLVGQMLCSGYGASVNVKEPWFFCYKRHSRMGKIACLGNRVYYGYKELQRRTRRHGIY